MNPVSRSVRRKAVRPPVPRAEAGRATLSPYRVPAPYGEHGGTDAVTTVAAPLLVAACVTLVGVIIQQQDALRLPGATLLILTLAILVLVSSVQCGAWARRYMATPDQMLAWWPGANPARHEIIVREQRLYSRRLNFWAASASLTFNVGVVLLWAGLAVALLPKAGSAQGDLRWAAAAVAVVGACVELIWTVLAQTVRYRRRRRATLG